MVRRVAPFVAIGACFATAAVVSIPGNSEWRHLGTVLLTLGVCAAGFRYGLAAGLSAGVTAALIAWFAHPAPATVPIVVEFTLYPFAGALAGWIGSRERHHRQLLEAAVRHLSAAHTELKDSFEGMKRAERLFSLGQLSAGLAHEIRNPLASIAGAVRILRRKKPGDSGEAECLDILDKEAQRLNRLLTSFLDFARPRRPEFHPVDVEMVIDRVMTLAAHGLGRDDIFLRKEADPKLPRPECDAEQLQQVLLNLAINAVQASPEGGEVVLAARQTSDGGEITLEVRDRGIGVPPEHIDRLFDPFFTTKQNGTGLGLPVAHEIVRQFGGTLAATRNPDRGMTFSIVLPVRRQNIHEESDPLVAR